MQDHTMTFEVELSVEVYYDIEPGDKAVGATPGVENVRAVINCGGKHYACPDWLLDRVINTYINEMVQV